ncbi:MAG: DUF389 domain-containing protein [Cellulophaga sp.]
MSNQLNSEKLSSQEEENGSGEEVKKDLKGLLESTKLFLSELIDIRTDTDQDATKETIESDISFKGHTTWILVCSIFIASVGLNANSTAVVIGAMLISPLMGPILGVGMSLAINDIDTLRRSLKNLAVMVVLSVLTAYLFFEFFPLPGESSELLARTKPDIRDVLIAFFGGLALVIARAKKGTVASVIFGVAIATALMPPLCTVGFGLAIGNFKYAGGALLLFGINTIYIALATFLVIKYLRFPMVRYANSQRRRLIARVVSLISLSVFIFSVYLFFKVYQESKFMQEADNFIVENVAPYQFSGEGRFLEDFTDLEYNKGEKPLIELFFMGSEIIPDNVIATWRVKKNGYKWLKEAELKVVQGSKNEDADQLKYVNELYETKKAELLNKDEKIRLLEEKIGVLSKMTSKQIPFQEISEEAKINYENLISLSFSSKVITDFSKIDTIPVFEVKWKKDIAEKIKETEAEKITRWLKTRLKDSTIQLKQVAD